MLVLLSLLPGMAAAGEWRAESLALTCYTCHRQPAAKEGGIPSLARLDRQELIKRLAEFRAGGGDATIMDRIAAAYTDEEIALIAEYLTTRGGRE
jgi:sulfide dehydrogenase cytochrome subunit